jgi:hypothetical protein
MAAIFRRRRGVRERLEEDARRPPFHKTREMRQVYGLAVLLVMLVVFFIVFGGRTPRVLTKVFPDASQETRADAESRAAETRRVREEHVSELPTLFDGALTDTANGAGFAETDGYRKLLTVLLDHAPSAASRPSPVPLDHAAALRDPDAWRGRWVRGQGVLVSIEANRLQTPVWNRTDVVRGFLSDEQGRQRVAFDLIDPPPLGPFHEGLRRDLVEVTGIFYRTVSYESRDGRPQQMPYLLARELRTVRVAPPGFATFLKQHTTGLVIMLVMLVCAGWVAFRIFKYGGILGVKKPKGPVGFRRMFEDKLRAERLAASKASTGKAPNDKTASDVNRRTNGDL